MNVLSKFTGTLQISIFLVYKWELWCAGGAAEKVRWTLKHINPQQVFNGKLRSINQGRCQNTMIKG